jgi:hypothetical protein
MRDKGFSIGDTKKKKEAGGVKDIKSIDNSNNYLRYIKMASLF